MAENQEPSGKPPLSPTPRRGPGGSERPLETDHLDPIASLANSVKLLANQLGATKAVEPEPEPPRRMSRRRQKFQRRADAAIEPRGDPASHQPPAPDDGPSPAPEGEENPSEPNTLEDSARNERIAWPGRTRGGPWGPSRQRRKRRATTAPLLVLLGCNLLMAAVGYILGQSGGNPAPVKDAKEAPAKGLVIPTDALGPQSVNERVMVTVNTALHDEKSNDFTAARRLYNEVVRRRDTLPGAEYRLAMLAIQRGDLLDADLHLVHSTAAGEFVAACDYVRATFAGAQNNYAEAGRQLQAATRVEPFNAKWFFCWGECLRRQGKPHAAIGVLQQGLDRAYSPEEGDLYFFKLGLAKIEAGYDDQFEAALASHLAAAPVAGDWLLLAAARDLENAAFPAAADHLQKASQAMPASLYEARVNDYFFRMQARQPEVSAFLDHPIKPNATEAGPSVMDPSIWTPDKADPGAWPSSVSDH